MVASVDQGKHPGLCLQKQDIIILHLTLPTINLTVFCPAKTLTPLCPSLSLLSASSQPFSPTWPRSLHHHQTLIGTVNCCPGWIPRPPPSHPPKGAVGWTESCFSGRAPGCMTRATSHACTLFFSPPPQQPHSVGKKWSPQPFQELSSKLLRSSTSSGVFFPPLFIFLRWWNLSDGISHGWPCQWALVVSVWFWSCTSHLMRQQIVLGLIKIIGGVQ